MDKFKVPTYSNLSLSFIIKWVVLHVIAWLIAWVLMDALDIFNPFVLINAILMGLIFGMASSLIQERLIVRTFHFNIPYWYPLSFVGWLLSGILLHIAVSNDPNALQIQLVLFFLLPAICQWFGLRKLVKQGWIWILANGIGGLVFFIGFLMDTQNSALVALTMGGVLQTIITGAIMYWLVSVSIPKVGSSRSNSKPI
jgi:hypothetical protein